MTGISAASGISAGFPAKVYPGDANTCVVLGDSITMYNSTSQSLYDVTRLADTGYFNWANYLLGQKLTLLHNGGIAGDRTDQILARVTTDVLNYAPRFCFVLGGINDVQQSVAVATTKANLLKIYNALLDKGIVVVALTVMPLATGHASLTNANVSKIDQINEFIRNTCNSTRGMILVDFYNAIIDPSSLTGAALANKLKSDNIHPGPGGARALGTAIYNKLNGLLTAPALTPTSPAHNYSLNSDGNQLFDNPLISGTGGTNSAGTTFTGTVPNNLTVSKAGTWGVAMAAGSNQARADGFGNDFQVIVTASGATDDLLFISTPDISSRVVAGDQLFGVLEHSLSTCTNLDGFEVYVQSTIDGVTTYAKLFERDTTLAIAQQYYDVSNMVGTIVTPVLKIPASASTIASTKLVVVLRFSSSTCGATLKVGRMALYKL